MNLDFGGFSIAGVTVEENEMYSFVTSIKTEKDMAKAIKN
jgi:hypothetical protein